MDAGWSPGERNRELGAGADRKARDVTGCPEYLAGSDRGSLSLVLLIMSEMGCIRRGRGREGAAPPFAPRKSCSRRAVMMATVPESEDGKGPRSHLGTRPRACRSWKPGAV